MIQCTVTTKSLFNQHTDCYAFMLEEGYSPKGFSPTFKELIKNHVPNLLEILKKHGFTGKTSESISFPITIDDRIIICIVVGIGKPKPKGLEKFEWYRRALGTIMRQVTTHTGESIALCLPPATVFNVTTDYLAQQTIIIANMATYHFNEFITQDERKKTEVFELVLCVNEKNKKAVQKGVKAGECIATAVNKARHWVDLPPSTLTPPHLADKAKEIAKKHGLTFTVFSEKQINEMGMGGLAAVSRGSELECRLLIMEYRAKRKTAPTIVFVGKGITFDSGGLSLKPPQHMETMKEDMSGAAAVIATMEALAQLKPNVHIIGITPLSENLPSGKANKPGDIVRFYNGKTAEVKNTDAEGRLVLADALSYAVKHYKPDAIIDIATLTGACAHALGPFFTGLMSQHDDLVNQLYKAAERSGDFVWRLPMTDDYKRAIRSDVADISNIGDRKIMAGAITAAYFLQHFVDDVPWAHLDIAGTAYNVPNISYYRPGATGAGVRLLVELAMSWK